MGEIITATYNFLDTLDNSLLIKNLTKYKQKVLENKELTSLINDTKKEQDNIVLIQKRKKIYEFHDYCMYMKYYNELSFIILRINKKYAEYTNVKEHHCHE